MIPTYASKKPVRSLVEFIQITTSLSPKEWIFRGQTKTSWMLRPKGGRPEFYRNLPKQTGQHSQLFDDDIRKFLDWRRQAVAYAGTLPSGDLECLAYAQHYGLATRLLDWTTNPLVALFFAVETNHDEEGVVYCHFPTTFELEPDRKLDEGVYQIAVFRPRPFDRRILAQQGLFTYHHEPANEFPASSESTAFKLVDGQLVEDVTAEKSLGLLAIIIPAHDKRQIMQHLNELGITRKVLFPDLEGLSSFINWKAQEEVLDLQQLREQMNRTVQAGL